ncbi:MAG TPA: hypothetical protein VGH50_00385 [Candidatus Binatia bacterium]|jgi:hypothetical protein
MTHVEIADRCDAFADLAVEYVEELLTECPVIADDAGHEFARLVSMMM